MTTPDDIALPPLQPHDHPEPHTMRWTELEMEAIRDFARAAVEQDRARRGEPEVWRYRYHPDGQWFYTRHRPSNPDVMSEPLYAAPQPAALTALAAADRDLGLDYAQPAAPVKVLPSDKRLWHLISARQREHGLEESVPLNAAMFKACQDAMADVDIVTDAALIAAVGGKP